MSAQPLGSYRGRIVRWGGAGFGFIACPDLKRDAYFKEDWTVGFEPDVGIEVVFDAFEYPGNKVVANNVRAVGAGKSSTLAETGKLAVRIKGLEHVTPVPRPAIKAPPSTPLAQPQKRPPATTLSGRIRELTEEQQARASKLRAEADSFEASAANASKRSQDLIAAAEHRVKELEKQIAEIKHGLDRGLADLTKNTEFAAARAKQLKIECAALEAGTVDAARKLAVEHLVAARVKVRNELSGRDRALAAAATAKDAAIRSASEETVRKYEQARAKVRAAKSDDDREAYGALEEKLRPKVKAYAEAVDQTESFAPIEIPVHLFGPAGDDSYIMVAPFAQTDVESDGTIWRVGSAVMHAVEQGRIDLPQTADAAIEVGRVAGHFAVRFEGVETDLMQVLLEDALDHRPRLRAMKVAFGVEEVKGVDIHIDIDEDEVMSLDAEDAERLPPPTGGTTREVAKRLGVSLDELVSGLVASGLPFEDDTLDAGTEESLRVLLGLTTAPDRAPEPAPKPGKPAPAAVQSVPLPVDVAARALGKLLRLRVIGGKHTRIENVWGHHFSDEEKDIAREVTEALIRVGILNEKNNMGSRHVSIAPRRLVDAWRIAEGKPDRDTHAALVSVR